jgi:ClpP class serine protease
LLAALVVTTFVDGSSRPQPRRWFFSRRPSSTLPSPTAAVSKEANATSSSSTNNKPYWPQNAAMSGRNNNVTKASDGAVVDVEDTTKKQQLPTTIEKDKKADDAAAQLDDDAIRTTPENKKDSPGDQSTIGSKEPDSDASSLPPTAPPPGGSGTTNSNNSTTASAAPPVRQRPSLFRHHHQQQQQQSGGRIIVLGPPYPGNNNLMPQQQQPQRPHQRGGEAIVGNELVEVLTGLAARIVRLGVMAWLSRHLMHREETISPSQQFVWEMVNERHDRDISALQSIVRRPPRGLRAATWRAVRNRFQGKPPTLALASNALTSRRIGNKSNPALANLFRRTVIVIEMSTYGKPSDSHNIRLDQLPDIVSFLTHQQSVHAFGTDKTTGEPLALEVVLCLASPGGSATLCGKAAAELVRFKQSCRNLTLTVCVDEVAASGGYMMASQADRIVAAPFAIVGSIGVIQEGFNFYELCKRYGIQPLVLKSGESKNPISSYGPISRQDLDLEQVRLKKVHRAFQDLVLQARPQISPRIMDGSIFAGAEAYELGLIDDIQTSEEYIFARVENGDRVLRLHRAGRNKNNAMRSLSIVDLLPHLQAFVAQIRDPTQAVRLMVRLGTYLTLARELIQAAHQVWR